MKLSRSVLPIIVLSLFGAVSAQNLTKPYTEWSQGEAQKLASQSGWAKSYTSPESRAGAEALNVSREQAQTANRGGGNPGSVARFGGNPPVVIRLHSAPVIRQAIVRMQQIAAKYDKMSDADKAAFDAGRKGYLDCAICKDYYVITLTKYTDASGQTVDDGMFQSLTLADLKGQVTLVNDKGESRPIYQFTPSKGGSDAAILFFARRDSEGKLLIGPDTKEIEVVFSNDFRTRERRYGYLVPSKFEFSTSKMKVGDEIQF